MYSPNTGAFIAYDRGRAVLLYNSFFNHTALRQTTNEELPGDPTQPHQDPSITDPVCGLKRGLSVQGNVLVALYND